VAVKPPAPKPAVTLTVGEGAPFKTIAAALEKAPAGARILVRAGTYHESLVLTRPVEIAPAKLQDLVTVEGGSLGCVVMKAERATLRGLTLRLAPGVSPAEYAVDVPRGQLVLEECALGAGATACAGVYSPAAAAVFRKCQLKGEKVGLHLHTKGKATLEDCTVSGNGGAGIVATQEARLNLRDCRVADNLREGLVCDLGVQGLIEECDFTGNRLQGVVLQSSANPTFRRARLFANRTEGALVTDFGKGVFEDCDLFENGASGLGIRTGGNPLARNCRFRANKIEGVVVNAQGLGTIEASDITGNGTFGVYVLAGSELLVKGCRVQSGSQDTVHVADKARATFEGCDLSKGPGAATVAIHEESEATFRRCKIHGAFWAILATARTKVNTDDCDIFDSAGPGLRLDGAQSASLIRSRFYRTKGAGIEIDAGSTATLDAVDVSAGEMGIRIGNGGTPTLLRSSIHDNSAEGLLIQAGGQGTVENCEVLRNRGGSVVIKPGGKTVVRGCKTD
jgi:F-box protein 11